MTLTVDAVFSYVACGAAAVTDHLLISPTPVLATTTPLPSISKASSNSISSIGSNTSPASTSSLPAGAGGSVGRGAQVRAPNKSEWDGDLSTDPDGRTLTVPSLSGRGDSVARGSDFPGRKSRAGWGPSDLYVPYEQSPASGRNYAPVEMPG